MLESPLRVAHGCSLHPQIISSTRPAFALPPALHISATTPSTTGVRTCTTDVVSHTQSTCSGFYKVKKCEVPLNRKRLRDDVSDTDEELAHQVIEDTARAARVEQLIS